jgi:pyrroline-5-carboxylate reductase
MAAALIGGILARNPAGTAIAAVDPSAAQRALLAERFGIATHAEVSPGALDADVIVMAVKPQQMREAATALAGQVAGRLVISVAAGIRSADLSRWLGGHQRIVRCMPNTPALVGEGITGLAAFTGVEPADRKAAEGILSSVGRTLWVEDDAMIDAVTAVSGSGPAYVFYFMEAMHAAALRMGFPDAQARELTMATFSGAARLAAESTEPPSVLRERVTSKGGTTAAALAVMGERDLARHIGDAIEAARVRAAELGDEFGRS